MKLEEILKALGENPELNKALSIHLAGTTDGKEILANHFNAEFEKKSKEKIDEVHASYDDVIFEILGVRKGDNVAPSDYVKELVKELSSLRGKSTTEQDAKIKELQDELKGLQDSSEAGKHWKGLHDAAVEKFQEQESSFKAQLEAKEGEFLKLNVDNDLARGRSGIKFKESLDESIINTVVDAEMAKVSANAKIIDGKVVYHKEDGTPWLNEQYKPITSAEIMQSKLGAIIRKDVPNGGGADPKTGASIVTVTGEEGMKQKLVLDKEKFSTKEEFSKHVNEVLVKQGVSRDSADYNSLVDAAYKDYEVEGLSLR